jgi:hypothetical protein
VVAREPGGIKQWLLGAHRAQIAAAVLLGVGLFVMPPLREATLDWALPHRVSKGFLGLGKRVHRNPLREPARLGINLGYWFFAAGTIGTLLWLQLPAARASLTGRIRRAGDTTGGGDTGAAQTVATVAAGTAAAISPVASAPTVLSGAAPDTGADHEEAGEPPESVAPERYAIEAELGRGGMGVVFRARDSMLDRPVALKQLFPELMQNRELAARFQREARVLARLEHRHVVQVFDLVADGSGMWMAMELLGAGSLADRLETEGALPFAVIRRLSLQMADALSHAHAQGIVHRDFKPDNVMLTRDGDAKVTDFGLAALAASDGQTRLTRPGTIMGSPAYMSPEQITGDVVDARTDIYAFGVTLYEMAAGRPPFEGNTTSVLTQHLSVDPQLPPPATHELPAAFVTLLEHMLKKAPAERIASMQEVIAALEACPA